MHGAARWVILLTWLALVVGDLIWIAYLVKTGRHRRRRTRHRRRR